MSAERGAAPPDLIRLDFENLDARETLRTTWANEELILVQSVLGHVHEGHGIFRGRRYPNTTMDDIVRALRLEPVALQGARQSLIDSVRAYARSAMLGNAYQALVDDTGEPLLGMSTLRFISADPHDVLRGLYLGGLRDDPDIRLEVERERGITIGGGASYYVDFERMVELGYSADELARGEWGDRIAELTEQGVVVEPRESGRPSVHYQYIRHRRGPGASDDAAIVCAGMLWGVGTALGVFLADAVDTLEKYVPRYSDQDERIALEIEAQFGDLRMDRSHVKQLIALAAATDGDGPDIPDSSLRHLLSIDRRTDLCPVEAHLLAVMGTPAPSIGLGHDRVPSGSFYALLRRRIEEMGR
ncbi:MAG: hypothetical protein GX446_13945 [Chthonomonadales bacterium]|nr:hypothetical protein [Chthonomonadales bacterium]